MCLWPLCEKPWHTDSHKTVHIYLYILAFICIVLLLHVHFIIASTSIFHFTQSLLFCTLFCFVLVQKLTYIHTKNRNTKHMFARFCTVFIVKFGLENLFHSKKKNKRNKSKLMMLQYLWKDSKTNDWANTRAQEREKLAQSSWTIAAKAKETNPNALN